MPKVKRTSAKCPCCREAEDFQKIIELPSTGLTIYRYTLPKKDMNQTNQREEVVSVTRIIEDIFIVHNTKNTNVTPSQFMSKFKNIQLSCPRCRKIVEHAQKLLQCIPIIKKDEIRGFCDLCMLKQKTCDDCENVLKEFIKSFQKKLSPSKECIKQWLSKMSQILEVEQADSAKYKHSTRRAKSDPNIDRLKSLRHDRELNVKEAHKPRSLYKAEFHTNLANRSHHQFYKQRELEERDISEKSSTTRLYYNNLKEKRLKTFEHIPPARPHSIEKSFFKSKSSFPNLEPIDIDQGFDRLQRHGTSKTFSKEHICKEYKDDNILTVADRVNTELSKLQNFFSEESLLTFTAVSSKTELWKRNFKFYFPKITKAKLTNKNPSSSELIMNTREQLEKTKDKKREMQRLAENLEAEKKKARELEEKKTIVQEKKLTDNGAMEDEHKSMTLKSVDKREKEQDEEENKNEYVEKQGIRGSEGIKGIKGRGEIQASGKKDEIKEREGQVLGRERKGESEKGEREGKDEKGDKEERGKRAEKQGIRGSDGIKGIRGKGERQASGKKDEIEERKGQVMRRERKGESEKGEREGKDKKGDKEERGKREGKRDTGDREGKDEREEREGKGDKLKKEGKVERVQRGKRQGKGDREQREEKGDNGERRGGERSEREKRGEQGKVSEKGEKIRSDEKNETETRRGKGQKTEALQKADEIQKTGKIEAKNGQVNKKAPKTQNEKEKLTKKERLQKKKSKSQENDERKDGQTTPNNEKREKERNEKRNGLEDLLQNAKAERATRQPAKQDIDKIDEKTKKGKDQVQENIQVEEGNNEKSKGNKVKEKGKQQKDRLQENKQVDKDNNEKSRGKEIIEKGIQQKDRLQENKKDEKDNKEKSKREEVKEKGIQQIDKEATAIQKVPESIQQLHMERAAPLKSKSPEVKVSTQQKNEGSEKTIEKPLKRKVIKKLKPKAMDDDETNLRQKVKLLEEKLLSSKDSKFGKEKLTYEEFDLYLKLVKIRPLKYKGLRPRGPIPKISAMLDRHHSYKKLRSLFRESDLELDAEDLNREDHENKDIIIGKKIEKYRPNPVENPGEVSLLYKSLVFDNESKKEIAPSLKPPTDKEIIPPAPEPPPQETLTKRKSQVKIDQAAATKGVIRYALSDRSFIDKGWTMLPTEKVVKKMNLYRMRPARPEFDWFKHNKSKGLMTYDTGEKLAEFSDKGHGRWFYKNGRIALDYYDAEEPNAQQRIVVYSSGEPDSRGRSQPFTILATFDYLGNCIVLDHSGKVRMKYNQSEGVVLDHSLGPTTHWKWHTLNDPPVLQQIMIDTQLPQKDPDVLKLSSGPDKPRRIPDEEMMAIEFDNFIKEKSKKINQAYEPFKIKMKAIKINDYFSLKVLDQETVYLLYRDGTTHIKLNVGMKLDHKEIVDTDTSELGDVANNLERAPARSESLNWLQKNLREVQRFDRVRSGRERRLQRPVPKSSADILTAAASRPLQTPIRTVPSLPASASSVTTNCYCSRKPTKDNLYYDTSVF